MKNVTNLDTDNINTFYFVIWQVGQGLGKKRKEGKYFLNLERTKHKLMRLKSFLGLYIEKIFKKIPNWSQSAFKIFVIHKTAGSPCCHLREIII